MRHDLLFVVKPGTFARVAYVSELPVAAAFKKQGVVITKETETTGRFGVDYTHIASVISRKATETEDKPKRTNNYEWIVPHRFSHNTNTNKDYVQMTTVPKHSNTKSKYFINGKEATLDEVKPYIIASYFSKKPESGNEVRTINVDNIKWIKQRGNIA